jgi:hypothetical protein
MSERAFEAREAERFGVGETTSRSPIGLYDFEGGCSEVEAKRCGLICRLVLGAVCVGGLAEVGVGSSSLSKGEVSGISSGSRANSSLKMFGFETRFDDLELIEEDCHEFRGDIVRCSGGGCAKAPLNAQFRPSSTMTDCNRDQLRRNPSFNKENRMRARFDGSERQ